jgi:hypothetical protein
MKNNNEKIAEMFLESAKLLEIKGVAFKPKAYRKVASFLQNSENDISSVYEEKGLNGLKEISGIGDSIAQKIKEFLEKGKIKYCEELNKETAVRQIITYYFETKGLSLSEIKDNAKKRKIIYSRFTKPAKQLLELAGSIEKSKEAMNKVAEWAKSRNLDYSIETVFKKWLELDSLKPKEIVKKPFFRGKPMIWSEAKRKWYVIGQNDEWLEFAGKESDMEWKTPPQNKI